MTRTSRTDAASGTAPEQLAGLLRTLWPALVRATRSVEQLPALPEAQVAVLRALIAAGGLTPGELALELRLARSTISNLVGELATQRLVERRPLAADGRSVLLVPTGRARAVLEAFSRGRVEVLERALDELSAADRVRLLDALPSLERLLTQLDRVAEAGPDSSSPARPAVGAGAPSDVSSAAKEHHVRVL